MTSVPPYKILLVTWVLAAATLSPSEIVLGAGAVVFAWVTWRGQRGNVLRQQNKDLLERNAYLEGQASADRARIETLKAQPNLETHALLLTKLIERIDRQEERQTLLWDKLMAKLDGIATAVTPPF